MQHNTLGAQYQKLRVVIFKWMIPNNVAISAAQIFASDGTIESFLSPKSWTLRRNSKILYDKVHTTDLASNSSKTFDISIPLNSMLQFVAGGTAYIKNGFYIYYISESAVNGPKLEGYWTTTFTDA